MNYYHETILNPQETTIHVEAFLEDTDYILDPNPYGEYQFSFVQYDSTAELQLEEMVEKALRDIELRSNQMSDKEPRSGIINRKGQFFCNQLFKPRLNEDIQYPMQLYRRVANLNLHLRDDPTGLIYLQASYVDLIPQDVPSEPQKEETVFLDW